MDTQLQEHKYNGDTYRLGTLVPTTFPLRAPSILTAPGFRVWTKTEITDFLRNKPVKRREQFGDGDWIINQRNLGSCNCAAGVGALRRSMVLGGRNDVPLFSWEFMYAQLVDGRDTGSMLDDGMKSLETVGVPVLDLARHPINKHFRKRDYSQGEYEAAKHNRAEATYQLSTGPAGELELATLLLSGQGAAVIAWHVDGSSNNLDRSGRVPGNSGPGNHAVCVDDVELIDGELEFDMPNSWGREWGDDGRGYLNYRRNLRRSSGYHGFYGILAGTNPGTDAPKIG